MIHELLVNLKIHMLLCTSKYYFKQTNLSNKLHSKVSSQLFIVSLPFENSQLLAALYFCSHKYGSPPLSKQQDTGRPV